MTQSGPDVLLQFGTPIITDRLPRSQALNDALRETIAARRSSDSGVVRSNRLGWQSDPKMLRWGGPASQAVARHFIDMCERHTADPRPPAPDRKPFLWLLDMWANVSPPGASNEYHSHPGAVWSAVYYVDDGRNGMERDSGGELVFQDPRMPMTRMLPLDLRYRAPDGSAYQEEYHVRPAAGTIVMFPPWLQHSVRPHRGQGERISIAMNATAYQPS